MCQTFPMSSAVIPPVTLSTALSVVVTHYRTPDLLLECLKKLAMHAPDAAVLVVDTGGEAADLVPARRTFPAVRFTKTVNHSLAHALNTGLKQTTTPFVLQMNADVMLTAGVVEAMLARFTDAEIGMVGPRCRDAAGKWQDQGLFYRPYYAALTLSERRAVWVPWLSGCCQLLRREVLARVGGMNSSLRFYNEDVEWCWRLRRAGYRCELVREAVLHVGGASTPPDERFLLEGLRGGMALSRQYRSNLYRGLHGYGVRAYAAWQSNLSGPEPVKKTGYEQVGRMFRAEQFDESPFGATLTDDNPAFARSQQPIFSDPKNFEVC